MPSSTTNWSSTETWQRLVAAIVATGVKASFPVHPSEMPSHILSFPGLTSVAIQLDLHEVAKMYGTTYDTIQNRYRKIRDEAEQLQKEVAGGEREVATPRKNTAGKGSGAGTPASRKGKGTKDALSTVTNGRVTKPSPTKKTPSKVVKAESKGESDKDIFADLDFGAGAGDVDLDVFN